MKSMTPHGITGLEMVNDRTRDQFALNYAQQFPANLTHPNLEQKRILKIPCC
jgi:hypothetical protein